MFGGEATGFFVGNFKLFVFAVVADDGFGIVTKGDFYAIKGGAALVDFWVGGLERFTAES